jgi:hypothetical protein
MDIRKAMWNFGHKLRTSTELYFAILYNKEGPKHFQNNCHLNQPHNFSLVPKKS